MSSRREFLFQIALIALLPARTRMVQAPSALSGLTRQELESLEAAVNEMIPAGEGMPSAAAAGGVAYLQQLSWQYPDILGELEEFLRILQQTSQTKFASDFNVLRTDERVA